MSLRLYGKLADVRRLTFVVAAVHTRVKFVGDFGAMEAVVGRLGRHGSNVKVMTRLDWI